MEKIEISKNEDEIIINDFGYDFYTYHSRMYSKTLCFKCDMLEKHRHLCKHIPCGNKKGVKRKDNQVGVLCIFPF
ncbi:MAG: hypothetical protein WCL70_07890 [Paludibacter sp.]